MAIIIPSNEVHIADKEEPKSIDVKLCVMWFSLSMPFGLLFIHKFAPTVWEKTAWLVSLI